MFVHVVFLKVGEIDTVKETYTADVFVQARWREPLFDGQTNLVAIYFYSIFALCPLHAAKPDTTKQSCLCRVWRSGVNWTIVISVFRLQFSLSATVVRCRESKPHRRGRHDTDRTVSSGRVKRCELGITLFMCVHCLHVLTITVFKLESPIFKFFSVFISPPYCAAYLNALRAFSLKPYCSN